MFNVSVIFDALLKMIVSLFKLLSFLIYPIGIFAFILLLSFTFFYIKYRIFEHIKPKKRNNNFYFTYNDISYVIERPYNQDLSKEGFFHKIFISFPKQFVYDKLTLNPNAFGEYGIHMVCGKQGAGKTITVVYLLQEWKKKYPQLKIYTNMAYKYETGELNHWKELIEKNNGIYGVVNVIDEIKTWWSNKESKDVPAEMLGEICQQRKQKKALIGTAQVFSEIAKPLRSQTHFVYIPKTFFGCLTIVRRTEAIYYNDEKDTFTKWTGFFFFPHTKKLREAYDTYKRIEKYKDIDFASSSLFNEPQGVSPSLGVPVGSKGKK